MSHSGKMPRKQYKQHRKRNKREMRGPGALSMQSKLSTEITGVSLTSPVITPAASPSTSPPLARPTVAAGPNVGVRSRSPYGLMLLDSYETLPSIDFLNGRDMDADVEEEAPMRRNQVPSSSGDSGGSTAGIALASPTGALVSSGRVSSGGNGPGRHKRRAGATGPVAEQSNVVSMPRTAFPLMMDD